MLRPDQKSAQFTANIIATKTDGTTLSDAETFMLVRTDREGSSRRHRLLFNYAEEDPIGRSKALIETDIVPDIKAGSKVYVYGHTDSLGADQVNLQLSRSRANDVKKILQEAISARGISGVKIYAYGLGEDDSPFENEFPEGRMYNRTVIIDIVP
jgi:flagellar motor protein MotB